MPEKIAVVGAGIMGAAIATRLLECGHLVHVFDVDAAKVTSLVARVQRGRRRRPKRPGRRTSQYSA